MIFFLALVILVLAQLRRDIRIVDRLKPATLLRSPIKRAGLVFALLLIVPLLFVQFSGFGGSLVLERGGLLAVFAFVSFLISYSWYRYLTWLDSLEREGRVWELTVFLLGCAFVFLVFPLQDMIVPALDLRLDGSFGNDWWYCVIAIGLVEELVKLIPLVLLVLFTKKADEPFDLILYGSISALGFAFIENTMYLADSSLYAVGGRVLYASVAHMFFTSIIAYCMAIARHHGKPLVIGMAVGLVLAAFAHGFYNFWLMAPDRPALLTTVFFLGNIHLWVGMKTNLINLSPHYQEQMLPKPAMFRYRIINALLAIFLFTYTVKFLLEGRHSADSLMAAQGGTMGALMLFLAVSFSSFRFVPGYIAPLHPQGGLWRFLLPVAHWGEDLSGRRLLLRIPENRSDARHYMTLHHMLPLEGRLVQRVLLGDDHDWYLFKPDRSIPFNGAIGDALLIRPHQANDAIPDDRYVLVVAMAFVSEPRLLGGKADKEQLEFTGFVHGKLL